MNNTYNTVDNQPHRETTNIPTQNHTTGTMEQIYQKVTTMELSDTARVEVNKLLACAMRAGVAWDIPAFFYEGFSNLTEAIKAGDPIDYENLDGMNVHCVNPDVGGLHWKLVRNKLRPADIPAGWRGEGANNLHVTAFVYSWTGSYGWSLWVEGEIPLVRKTADRLKVGTYFRGEIPGYMEREAYVGGEEFGIGKRVHRAPSMIESTVPASEWVVLEEYGTSPKPEGK